MFPLGPGSHLDFFNLANTLCKQGNLEEAVVNYRKAAAANPEFVGAHYNLGNTFGSQDQSEQAEIAFKKAINLDGGIPWRIMGLESSMNARVKTQKQLKV